MQKIVVRTASERFYNITDQVRTALAELKPKEGVLTLFCLHTSCALAINEAHEDSARVDMESFLRHLAPRTLPFITHVSEGADDSPSHMKAVLLQPSLQLIVAGGEMLLGRWQGIFLAEFRASARERTILVKFQPD